MDYAQPNRRSRRKKRRISPLGILIATIGVLAAFGLMFALDAFFDRFDLRFQSPVIFRRPVAVLDRKVPVVPKAALKKKPMPTPAAGNPVKPADPQMMIRSVFGADAEIALAIARAESGLDCSAVSVTNDYGVMQINGVHKWRFGGAPMTDCMTNILVARQIQLEQGFEPWTTYRTGTYLKYL